MIVGLARRPLAFTKYCVSIGAVPSDAGQLLRFPPRALEEGRREENDRARSPPMQSKRSQDLLDDGNVGGRERCRVGEAIQQPREHGVDLLPCRLIEKDTAEEQRPRAVPKQLLEEAKGECGGRHGCCVLTLLLLLAASSADGAGEGGAKKRLVTTRPVGEVGEVELLRWRFGERAFGDEAAGISSQSVKTRQRD